MVGVAALRDARNLLSKSAKARAGTRAALVVSVLCALVACGARTPLEAAATADGDAADDATVACTPEGATDAAAPSPGRDGDSGDVDPSCAVDADPSASAVTAYGVLGEGINSECGADGTCSTFGSTAFEFVPQHDLRLSRVELHTSGGRVGVLDSDCGRPGATLFEGPLEAGESVSPWRGATLSPPLRLTGGHRYFVYESPDPASIGHEGNCSVPERECGSPVREFTGPVGGTTGPWMGPYTRPWLVRFTGVCL